MPAVRAPESGLRQPAVLVKKTAATRKKHRWGIINAVVLQVHNGHAESINSRLQRMKSRARGFCNREHCRNASDFHRGGLDLYPAQVGNR